MKNLPNNMKDSLVQLRAIKPEAAWLEQNKKSLMASLAISNQPAEQLSYTSLVSLSLRDIFARLAWQPIGALVMFLAIIVGPSMAAVNAAKGSLPGDALYPVKRSLERARLSFTFSTSRRAELEVDLVSTRLHELQRLTKEQAPSPERQKNIALAVEELKKDTATVKTRLDAATQNGDASANKEEAVALAKIVDLKTSDYQETLKAAIDDITTDSSKGTGGSLTQAISTVQEVTINALNILVNENESESTEQPISDEDLKSRVDKQFSSVKQSVDAFRAQVAALNGPKPEPVDVMAPNPDQPLTLVETEVIPEQTLDPKLAELLKTLDAEITPLITYAEELIKLQNFAAALEQLTKANNKLDELSLTLVPEEEATNEVTEPPTETPAPATEEPAPTPQPEAVKAEETSTPTAPTPTEPSTTDSTPTTPEPEPVKTADEANTSTTEPTATPSSP